MILTELDVDPAAFESATGWAIKAEGACRGDVCVPLPDKARGADGRLDVRVVADRLGMPIVRDEEHGLWALGPETTVTGRVLASAQAPELELPDLDGNAFRLSSLRGKKVVLVAWASWCGCRMDLPLWQSLRERVQPLGVEIVTVALDVDPEAARPWIEAAAPEHPSVVDRTHVTDERFGFVNVPNGVWIDEDGTIVRPAEPMFPGHNADMQSFRKTDLSTLPPETVEMMVEARKITSDPEGSRRMIEDWAEHGADSQFALTPDEVLRRAAPRGADEAIAAAEFELGEHLHSAGDHAAAIPHWQEAHRRFPSNWTYKRQAWNIEDPYRQGRTAAYPSSWIEDLKEIGGENYYPAIIP
jgi:peroxiredoxin